MNLGIVIAVSNYGVLGNDLPGCFADGAAIAKILKTDNKFDDVLYLSEKTKSSDIKPELIKFINDHKNNDINDVVFYFTGHGDFSGDEFYYLLSDYDRKRKKQTCLENTELDNLLKTLNPQNAIKIVDACHSGTPYIKDPDAFDSYLKGTQGEFKKCYFMYSSQADQYSYQDSKLSFFTRGIVESVKQHSSDSIRYKDIIDYVSDLFSGTHNQTPFFIVQADFTESFCSVSDSLRQALNDILLGDMTECDPKEGDEEKEQKSLLELVTEDASRYCSEEEALSYLSDFFSKIKNAELNDKIIELYDVGYEDISDYAEIPAAISIGKWLDSNEHDFFAEPYKEQVRIKKRVHKDPMRRIMGLDTWSSLIPDDDENYKYVISKEEQIKGFKSTVDLPVKLLKVTIEAKFPNIDSASVFIIPIISKTEMRVFYSFNFYEQKGWSDKEITGSIKWLTEKVDIKDTESHSKLCSKIIEDFSEFVYTQIAENFNLMELVDENVSDKPKT